MTSTAEPAIGQFEERLLAELKEYVGTQPASTPHRPRIPRHPRVPLAATAIGAAAVAAGLLIATAPAPHPAPGGYSLDAFLTAAATAARAQDTRLPKPDQAFYEKQFTRFPSDKGGQCAIMLYLYPLTGVGDSIIIMSGSPRVNVCSHYFKVLKGPVLHFPGPPHPVIEDHLYPPLYSLPTRPAPLRSALYAAVARGPAYWNLPASYTAPQVVFTLAGRLLEGPVSGSLRAALYEVIAGLPGVSLIQHATDAIGRHGVGIEMRVQESLSGPTWIIELIIAPHTYRFLGMIYGPSGGWHTTYADIGSGLVTRSRS